MKSIEEKILQRQFRSEFHRLIVNLTYTYTRMAAEIEKVLAPFEITVQQFNILRILRGQSPNSASATLLRQRLVDKNADVSRLIDRLLKKNLLTRDRSTQDRRQVDVRITPAGLDLLEAIDSKQSAMDAVCGNLSVGEARTLNDLLDKMGK